MIKKSQLKFGDILVTRIPERIFKYYIFCNTPFGPSFISECGHNNVEDYDEDLRIHGDPHSDFTFIQVFRPDPEVAHIYQDSYDAYKDYLPRPLDYILSRSFDITNLSSIDSLTDEFINIEYYV